MEPLVGIVVLNWNNLEDSVDCIESLERIEYSNYKIIFVDNGSNDNSPKEIKKKFQDITVIENGENLGFSAGNNVGIRKALEYGAEYVLVLNNDSIVARDFLTILVDSMEKNNEIGVIGPKVLNENNEILKVCARNKIGFLENIFVPNYNSFAKIWPNNPIARRHFYNGYKFDEIKEVYTISGSCMLFRKEVFDEIGLLDENVFLYQEENILAEKIKKTNFKIVINPVAIVHHKGAKSTKTVRAFSFKHAARSQIYFCKKYLGINAFSLFFMKSMLLLNYGIRCIRGKDFRLQFKDFIRDVIVEG
ncbi:glycosyltransferase family 2 protein [Bacillus luti]|uniref:glycosyltransferase family 2 protein n=1 Tax=Bacillus luti TaxID=2026191 RepID=UPI003774D69F